MTGPVELIDLPLYTIIESPPKGLWIRMSEKFWEELSYHCIDCIVRVYDDISDRTSCDEEDDVYESKSMNAQTFFGDWTIVAIGVDKVVTPK